MLGQCSTQFILGINIGNNSYFFYHVAYVGLHVCTMHHAVPTVFVMDILRLFVAIAPGRCSWDNKGGGQCGTYSMYVNMFCARHFLAHAK